MSPPFGHGLVPTIFWGTAGCQGHEDASRLESLDPDGCMDGLEVWRHRSETLENPGCVIESSTATAESCFLTCRRQREPTDHPQEWHEGPSVLSMLPSPQL